MGALCSLSLKGQNPESSVEWAVFQEPGTQSQSHSVPTLRSPAGPSHQLNPSRSFLKHKAEWQRDWTETSWRKISSTSNTAPSLLDNRKRQTYKQIKTVKYFGFYNSVEQYTRDSMMHSVLTLPSLYQPSNRYPRTKDIQGMYRKDSVNRNERKTIKKKNAKNTRKCDVWFHVEKLTSS